MTEGTEIATGAPRRPMIGLAGFFSQGNFGDDLFIDVFHQYLGDAFDLKILPDRATEPYFSRPVKLKVARSDAVIVGGGDLVRPWSLDRRYFNQNYLAKPVFVIGVGVPTQTGRDGARFDYIAERYHRYLSHPSVRLIRARDAESARWISTRAHPTVAVSDGPDIVCALSLPRATKPEGAPILGIATRIPGRDDPPTNYAPLAELGRRAIAQGWRVRQVILSTGPLADREMAEADLLDIPGKELVRNEKRVMLCRKIGECSAFASMKFHGVVVAAMYGVPVVGLVDNSKMRNFMARFDRPDLIAAVDMPDLANRLMPFPAAIDREWIDRLRRNAIAGMAILRTAIGDALADPVSEDAALGDGSVPR